MRRWRMSDPEAEYERILEAAEAAVEHLGKLAKELFSRLRGLDRCSHCSCDDGDGHTDEWDERDPEGEYVMWSDIEEIIEEFGGKEEEE